MTDRDAIQFENAATRTRLALLIVAAGLLLPVSPAIAAADETPKLPFYISRPAGNGPFPAAVILHDCSGLGPRSSGSPWRWASWLTAHGYVTVWPDSFTTRDHPRGVCTDRTPPRVGYQIRATDAYAALAYLRSLPFVDAHRVVLMGVSHGGSSTLAGIADTPRTASHRAAGFAAAIALYPNCNRSFGGWRVTQERKNGQLTFTYAGAFKPLAPLLILIGELDDWTPAAPCRKLAEAAAAAGFPVEIKIYPGAHHSFDSPAPIRYVAERNNINAPTGRGATTGGNAGAWAEAIRDVEQFLRTRLMPPR